MEESYAVSASRSCAYLLEKYKWMMNGPVEKEKAEKKDWVTDVDIDEIIKCHNRKMTAMQIATAVGRSHSLVVKVLEQKGLAENTIRRASDKDRKIMWQMKRDGKTVIDIMRATGFCERSIQRHIKIYEDKLNERHA